MLLHSFIFLCIAIYASCVPVLKCTEKFANNMPQQHNLIKELKEIMDYLEDVKQGKDTMISQNTGLIHVEIPDIMMNNCVSADLKRYLDLFNSLDTSYTENVPNPYDNMVKGLKMLLGQQSLCIHLPQQSENQDCKTRSIGTQELLVEFHRYLKELSSVLHNNKNNQKPIALLHQRIATSSA